MLVLWRQKSLVFCLKKWAEIILLGRESASHRIKLLRYNANGGFNL